MSDPTGIRTPSEHRARSTLYNVVADLMLPATDDLAARLASGELSRDVREAGERLDLPAALRLADDLDRRRAGDPRALDEELLDLFGPAAGGERPPYSTEYDPDAGFRKEQELADIAGTYAAWGVALADDVHERVDHFGVEADFLSFLSLKMIQAVIAAGPAERDLVERAQSRFARWYVLPAARELSDSLSRSAPDSLAARAMDLLVALADSEPHAPDVDRRRIVSLPVVP